MPCLIVDADRDGADIPLEISDGFRNAYFLDVAFGGILERWGLSAGFRYINYASPMNQTLLGVGSYETAQIYLHLNLN